MGGPLRIGRPGGPGHRETRGDRLEAKGAVWAPGNLREVGAGEKCEHLPVIGEHPSEPRDASADRHEVDQQFASSVVTERPCVEPIDIVLDRVGRVEIAGDGRVQDRGNERGRVEVSERRIDLDPIIEIVEEPDWAPMLGDHHVPSCDHVEPRRLDSLRVVRFGRDPEMKVASAQRDVRAIARHMERAQRPRVEFEPSSESLGLTR
jgi:hypothetical protein